MRKRHKPALVIQCAWRSYVARKELSKMKYVYNHRIEQIKNSKIAKLGKYKNNNNAEFAGIKTYAGEPKRLTLEKSEKKISNKKSPKRGKELSFVSGIVDDLKIDKEATYKPYLVRFNKEDHLKKNQNKEDLEIYQQRLFILKFTKINNFEKLSNGDFIILRKDVNFFDKKLRTPLYYAVKSQNMKIIEFLLESGARPNTIVGKKETVLHLAFSIGNYEIIKLLMLFGANPFIQNFVGKLPHQVANPGIKEHHLEEFVRKYLENPRGSQF